MRVGTPQVRTAQQKGSFLTLACGLFLFFHILIGDGYHKKDTLLIQANFLSATMGDNSDELSPLLGPRIASLRQSEV